MLYLILWQDNPERVRFFWYETTSATEERYLDLCHGKLLGVGYDLESDAALVWLSSKIVEPMEPCYDSEFNVSFLVSKKEDFQIINTGFLM